MQSAKFRFFLTFLHLATVSSAPCQDEDGMIDESRMLGVAALNTNGHIIGGQEALLGQFPWQTMVLKDLEFLCGGSLISDRWILTAAHCFETEGDYAVRLGTLNKDDYEENRVQMDVPQENIFMHEDYDAEAVENDIALLKLPVAIALPRKPTDNFYINAIRLPKKTQVKQNQTNKMAITSGWGRFNPDDGKATSNKLKWISLSVMSNDACGAGFGGTLPSSNICLDTKSQNGVCGGDSGGPLVILGKDKKYTLHGVTSFSAGSTCLKGPNAFARVTSYLDWIKKISGVR